MLLIVLIMGILYVFAFRKTDSFHSRPSKAEADLSVGYQIALIEAAQKNVSNYHITNNKSVSISASELVREKNIKGVKAK